MNKYVIFLLLLFFFSCSNHSNNETDSRQHEQSVVHDTVNNYMGKEGVNAQNIDTSWVSYKDVELRLLNVYAKLKDFRPTLNNSLKDFISDMNEPVAIFIAADLKNDRLIDLIAITFFLKVYLNNLNGDEFLYNVSCCVYDSIYTTLFVQRIYRITKLDPTTCLFSDQIYNWVVTDPTYSNLPELKKLLDEIAQIKEMKDDI